MAKPKTKNEEQTKIDLVIPLLRALGFCKSDIDLEKRIQNKSVDIALKANGKTTALVEVKDKNEDLKKHKHINQIIDYGMQSQQEFVALANGVNFEIYATFAKGVPNPAQRILLSCKIENPKRPPPELTKLFHKKSMMDFQSLKKKISLEARG